MSQCAETQEVVKSECWQTFFISLAAGLHLNLAIIRPDGIVQKVPSQHPDDTIIDLMLNATDYESEASDGCTTLHLSSGLHAAVSTLKDGQKIVATECTPNMFMITNSPLEERLSIVIMLLNSVLTLREDDNDRDLRKFDFSAFRHFVDEALSMSCGEDFALTKLFEVIVSALSLVLNAEGCWFESNVPFLPRLVIVGNKRFVKEFAQKQDYSDTFTVDIANGISLGKLCVVLPDKPEHAERLLSVMAQECSVAIEKDNFFKLSHNYMDTIIGSVATGIILIDKNGKVIRANTSAKMIFEEVNAKLIGSHITDWPGAWTGCIASQEGASTGGEKEVIKRKDTESSASLLYVDWRVFPLVQESNTIGWVLTVDDRTNYYLNNDKAREAERNAAIAGMVGTLAHELRNPITAASGLLQLMSRKKDSDQTRNYIGLVLKELERVTRLLNEFLQLGKPSSIEIEPIDPAAFLREMMPLFQGEAIETNSTILLEVNTVTSVAADPGQLTQVMLNLVRNAFQASGIGGTIIVRLEERKGWVCIEVRDNGPGIPQEDMNNIFLPFFTTKEKGTGLGLSVVQTIIHNHGGTIKAENGPEGGAIFTILFPPAVKKRKELLDVLIIMDDNRFNHLMRDAIQKTGAKIRTVPDFNAARKAVNDCKPTLVIIGSLSGKSTTDAAQISKELWPDSKVIVLVPYEPRMGLIREESELLQYHYENSVNYIRYPADLIKVTGIVQRLLSSSK